MLRDFREANVRAVLTLGLVLLFLFSMTRQAAGPLRDQPIVDQIDAIFSGAIQPGQPGAAVLVKKDGTILFAKGYGERELPTQAKIGPQTNFRLASFTKQFTAMAILLLVHDGKLHYDDRLTDIFLDFPPYGKSITIRHLLTHTSGLPDYEDLMEKEEKAKGPRWSPEHQIQDEQVLSLLEKQPAGKFAAGTSWAYSNSGYVVLGLVVRKVSGMPYRDFLQKRIFTPVGMNHSIVYQKGINEVTDRAFGHSKENDRFVETDQSSTSATLGDGGVYSNLEDLAKWDDALEKHPLLSEKEMAPALTPARLADGSATHWPKEAGGDNLDPGKPVSYGFGWFLDSYQGHARMWHSGSTMGFRTVIERFAADGLTIVILSNRSDLDPKSLAETIACSALPPAAR
jgi:CubicO group peptidase (beta-lactamase class C family)